MIGRSSTDLRDSWLLVGMLGASAIGKERGGAGLPCGMCSEAEQLLSLAYSRMP